MGLTNETTLKEIQLLFDMFFIANAKLDRIVYELDIKFNMPRFQTYIHHEHSHKMPLLADMIQEFGSLRGDNFYRGAIGIENKDYIKSSDTMYDYAILLAEVEKQCAICINTAIQSQDLMYEDYLRDFEITQIAPLTKQATVFYRAMKDYENSNSIYKWNRDFPSFIIEELRTSAWGNKQNGGDAND